MAVLPANPKVIGSKPYTGNSDGAAAGPRAGMDEWIRQAIKHGDGAFWRVVSHAVRTSASMTLANSRRGFIR